MNRWIEAARPRTLPLAIASILLGNFLAYTVGKFSFLTAILSVSTTLLLQILSNFANDYGDSANGVDNKDRKVALRAVQTGQISRQEMKLAVICTAILSFFSGVFLLYFSLKSAPTSVLITFFILGILSIAAAIAYTVGKNPYGYMGLGDLFVFLFFGTVGTFGTYYLQTQSLQLFILIPASGCGFLSVAVLNLNNLRDIENDKKCGKNSIPVRIGKEKGIIYQKLLLLVGVVCFLVYQIFQGFPITLAQQIILLAGSYPLLSLIKQLDHKMTPKEIDPYLKKTALRTLLLIIVFGLLQIFYSH